MDNRDIKLLDLKASGLDKSNLKDFKKGLKFIISHFIDGNYFYTVYEILNELPEGKFRVIRDEVVAIKRHDKGFLPITEPRIIEDKSDIVIGKL